MCSDIFLNSHFVSLYTTLENPTLEINFCRRQTHSVCFAARHNLPQKHRNLEISETGSKSLHCMEWVEMKNKYFTHPFPLLFLLV